MLQSAKMLTGKLVITLKGALLTNNVKLIKSMNPFVVIQLGDISKTSGVDKSGGKQPVWTDRFDFYKTVEDMVNFEVYHKGLTGKKIVGEGKFCLVSLTQSINREECINLYKKDTTNLAGKLVFQIKFTPDIQVGFQQGQLVQIGEAALDMNLRVVTSNLTRDTQWFGQMSCSYEMSCGDKKFTSAISYKCGKNPQWSDSFKIIKPSDTDITIDITNINNKSLLATCNISHAVLKPCEKKVITVPLEHEKQSAGKLLLEVSYNSLPQDAQVAPLPINEAVQEVPNQSITVSQIIPSDNQNVGNEVPAMNAPVYQSVMNSNLFGKDLSLKQNGNKGVQNQQQQSNQLQSQYQQPSQQSYSSSFIPPQIIAPPIEQQYVYPQLPEQQVDQIQPQFNIPSEKPQKNEKNPIQQSRVPIPISQSRIPIQNQLPRIPIPIQQSRIPIPIKQSAMPIQQSAMPVQQSTVPIQQSSMPIQQSVMPIQQSTIPVQQSGPVQQSEMPQQQNQNIEFPQIKPFNFNNIPQSGYYSPPPPPPPENE